jgi:hypothetical protein
MEQAHWERAFVFRLERNSFFLQELSEVRAQLDIRGGFPTAGCSCFEEDTVCDFTKAAVELAIGEPVIAPKASYGLALLGNKLKSRMRGHGIAQALWFAVDPAFG